MGTLGSMVRVVQSIQVSTWLSNIAFSFVTALDVNFHCNQFRIMLEIVAAI